MDLVVASANLEKARLLKQFLMESLRGSYRVATLFDKTLSKDHDLLERLRQDLAMCRAASSKDLCEKKARHVAELLGLPAVAEETILTLPVLGTEERAFVQKVQDAEERGNRRSEEAVFSFQSRDDGMKKSCQRILNALSRYDDTLLRAASLTSYLAWAQPSLRDAISVVARMEGYIHDCESGRRTFEYGSLFVKHEYAKTLSDLPESVLLRISHRKKGVEALCRARESFRASSNS